MQIQLVGRLDLQFSHKEEENCFEDDVDNMRLAKIVLAQKEPAELKIP